MNKEVSSWETYLILGISSFVLHAVMWQFDFMKIATALLISAGIFALVALFKSGIK